MIALASDHAGYELKNDIIEYLGSKGIEYKDFGCFSLDSADYPDYALMVAKSVALGEHKFGILVCGTGTGMAITANKVRGIRCANCFNEFTAKASREHNNANVLALGARIISLNEAISIVDSFINTDFSNEKRHIDRVNKISKAEGSL